MTKQEFLTRLKMKLSVLSKDEITDIIDEYSEIIDEKINEGKTEQQAVHDFGNVDELAREILKAYKIDDQFTEKEDWSRQLSSILNDVASFLTRIFGDLFEHMNERGFSNIISTIITAIPTSAGTGSEVTPFAVITDEKTGVKYPLADYELLPNMAIIDTDFHMSAPKGLTAASGIDAVTHAVEAYVAMLATDYTDGLALQALKNIFKYLPRAYENGQTDVEAREKMANAATIAGMAFANAFLGICHSMAHKLGAFHHLPHGVANALMIEEVIRFNASEAPVKMGTFSQYDHPHTLARYAEIADYLGLGGKSDEEKLENLINAINELKAKVGIKATIKDYGIDEQDFLNRLDDMVEQAFDDQCTGANPRYPLMSELKQMYLNAYYGKHFVEPKMPATDLDVATPDAIKAPYRKGKKA